MNLSNDIKILNIPDIIKNANQYIIDLNLNYNENKINYNFYKYKLYIFNKILELINKDTQKIKFEIIEISNNYYINEEFLKIFNLHHLYIENIKIIFNKFLDNINIIVDKISNNTKEYNKLDSKYIYFNNEIIKIINLNEFNFNDNILINLINSNNFNEDILKYCNLFNSLQINYYRELFNYIDFKIIKYQYPFNEINNKINTLTILNENLQKQIINLNIENKEYKKNIKLLMDKVNKLENLINTIITEEEDLEYFKI